MNKKEIRKIYKEKRLNISELEIKERSKTIGENFIKNFVCQIDNFKDQKFAFYYPSNKEVEPNIIIKYCQSKDCKISLPKISLESKILQFKEYQNDHSLIFNKNYKNILEPSESCLNIDPDIIFVPLVVCDKYKNRIGMGGGFYDATIKYLRSKNSKKIFVGLAYNFQEIPRIVTQKQDQKLDFIILEDKIIS